MTRNIFALLAVGDLPWCDELRIYIAENNSKDNTRTNIVQLAGMDSRIIPVFLGDLDEHIPVREARIAFCRDRLLDEICKNQMDGLYIPVDLDAEIAGSLNLNVFVKACRLVTSGTCTAVFPSSFPYYYDIHALREANWCPKSCWKEIQDTKSHGSLWYLLVYIRYVTSRQRPHSRLQAASLIPVDSAFGGVGIYSLRKIIESGARYSTPDLEKEDLRLCEHVVFNSFLERLFIYPEWAIKAPLDHIELCQLPDHQKAWRIIRAGLSDIKRIPFAIVRLFKSRLFNSAGN